MPFGHVPVARVGAVLSEWSRVSLTGRYTYTCSFYRETDEYENEPKSPKHSVSERTHETCDASA